LDNTDVIMSEVERWQSLEEISKHLGVSKDTIRIWIKKDTIPYHKIGRQYRFRISEVDAWVESGQSANADK
jgi:excisionase family DNA binding protein